MPPLDFFIANVALSSIHERLGANAAQLQLVISGYAASYGVFLIIGGRLGDLYGRKRCFLAGMGAFTLTCLGAGLAATPNQLVLLRVVQGMAASVLLPQVLGSVRALFHSERDLAKAMSAYGFVVGMAAAVGQFSGGALIQWNPMDLGWRTVFLVNVPVGLMAMLLGWKLVPETSGAKNVTLDLGGAALVSGALACIVVPLSVGRQQGWPAWVFVAFAAVPVLGGAFVWFEKLLKRTGGMPLVDFALLRISSFRRGVLVAMLFFFTTGFYMLFGIYQQLGRGVDPLQVGLAIVPYGLGLFLGPLVSAPFVKLRPNLLAIGMSIQCTFYALVGVLVWIGISGPRLSLVVFLAGLGQGIAFPRLFATVLGDVPPAMGGVASGIVNSALQLGGAISVAAVGALFFSVLDGGSGERAYAHAFAIAQWTLTAGLFLGMLIAIPPRRPLAAPARE